ncbi:MAG TPA: cell division protein ZapA [Pyrinomonadaceae bacterium]|jgi:cell division protein ZapA (FtsZ GTPase activity inhibitor)
MTKPVRVNILEQTYSLHSEIGREHVLEIAGLVDERMRRISSHARSFDLSRVAVLAALHIADEMQRMKDRHEQ